MSSKCIRISQKSIKHVNRIFGHVELDYLWNEWEKLTQIPAEPIEEEDSSFENRLMRREFEIRTGETPTGLRRPRKLRGKKKPDPGKSR